MVYDIALLRFEKQLDDLMWSIRNQLLLPRLSLGLGIWRFFSGGIKWWICLLPRKFIVEWIRPKSQPIHSISKLFGFVQNQVQQYLDPNPQVVGLFLKVKWMTNRRRWTFTSHVCRLAEDRDAVQRHGDDHQGNPSRFAWRQGWYLHFAQKTANRNPVPFDHFKAPFHKDLWIVNASRPCHTATSPKLSQPQHRPSQQKQDSMANVAIALHLRLGPSLVNPAAFVTPEKRIFLVVEASAHFFGSGRFSVFHNLPSGKLT